MSHPLVEIAPHGTGVVLPALVVGIELRDAASGPDLLQTQAPEWLWLVSQQAGGFSMSYPQVLGAILRLDANRDRGTPGMNALIDGLRWMAEIPGELAHDAAPVLKAMKGTWGEPYAPALLDRLDAFLRRCLHLPKIQSGVEAFIRFESCDVLDFVSDWRLLQHKLPLTPADRHGERGISLDDSNIHDCVLEDCGRFAEEHVALLNGFGRVGLFLLWENSD